jgi:hypothetical protein
MLDRVHGILSLNEPTLSLQPQRFGEPLRIISLTVVNQTASTISRIAFTVRLMATGREVPIVTDQVNYQIPGGLQPDETATWSLQPNMFSEIGRATPAEGNFLQMTVEVGGTTKTDSGAISDETPCSEPYHDREEVYRSQEQASSSSVLG